MSATWTASRELAFNESLQPYLRLISPAHRNREVTGMKPESKGRAAERQNKVIDPKHVQVSEGRKHGSSIQTSGTESSKSYSEEADVEGARQLRPSPPPPIAKP
jgi:hypothetical protein